MGKDSNIRSGSDTGSSGSDTGSPVVKKKPSHRCNAFCLGPLTFHCQALGDMVSLSHGGQVAARKGATFKNGLVFSCRLVVIEEKICLRVNGHSPIWHGALRLGFTSVHPVSRSLPLPPMAIPDLSETPDYWATPVHESYCLTGSELQFWVSSQGMICMRTSSCKKLELLKGVDVSKPLWAMIDIYGQTLSISLLGSAKRRMFYTKRSCPAPKLHSSTDHYISGRRCDDSMSSLNVEVSSVEDCVVCMEREAEITLTCGHRCLCLNCAARIVQEFGSCPLCRHVVRNPSVDRRCV